MAQSSHTSTPHWLRICGTFGLTLLPIGGQAAPDHVEQFEKEILPILENHCYSCHGEGENKGNVVFDEFGSTEALMGKTDLWVHALKNIRSGLMPPPKKKRPTPEEIATLETWIKQGPLKLDPQNPDPGRVTLRRLNRVEYRNTIRDLMGVDFKTEEEFPADDTGYGFDTIGDALTTSPMLLEKYMQAAEAIVAKAIPLEKKVPAQRRINAKVFAGNTSNERWISFYDPANLSGEIEITQPGTYKIVLNSNIRGSFAFDPGRARYTWTVAGKQVAQEELQWKSWQAWQPTTELKLESGKLPIHLLGEPLVTIDKKPPTVAEDGPPSVDLEIQGVTVIGPLEPEFAVHPPGYDRFFTRAEVPQDPAERKAYATEILKRFTTSAFRRPVDDGTLSKLTEIASAADETFESGIGKAITAVIASPRFLFRMEDVLPGNDPAAHPLLDEYALASRLSYFLWSTMPDDALFQLAAKGELRKNLTSQVKRMLDDKRSDQFVENFAGQWLQTRDVEGVSIDARIVQARDVGQEKETLERSMLRQRISKDIDEAEKAKDQPRLEAAQKELAEFRAKIAKIKRPEFSGQLRSAMRLEAELLFRHLLREDRSVLELIENDSTFLNQVLATHYGVPDVTGDEMRLVKLPGDSPRGGVITMGTVLAVTSNPTRTSPVKRGLFILDNILGTPPPPAPPNIPSLEASEKSADGRRLSLRDALALHREQPLCSSCHNRMDPLGLALENFNAMGAWRDKELGMILEPAAGQLITGEKFTDVRELKHLLVTARRRDYYRCLTEKLMTYALGRGPQPCDITTVDAMVEKLDATNGKFSELIMGIIESPAFQKRQRSTP